MRIKHWQGYGTVTAIKVKDRSCDLHIRVSGNHECGVVRDDDYDVYNWLFKKFVRSAPDYYEWRRGGGTFRACPGWDAAKKEEVCDYCFAKGEW